MSTTVALPFMGETLSSWDPSDSTVLETTAAATFTAALSTNSISVLNNASYIKSPNLGSNTTLWFASNIFSSAGDSSRTNTWINFLSGSVIKLYLTWNTATGAVKLYDAANNLLGTWSLQGLTLQRIDMKVVVNSVSGSFTFYTAGGFTATVSHDFSGIANIDQVQCFGATTGNNSPIYYSQCVLDTKSTIGRYFIHKQVDTNSATNVGWTGAVGNINELPTVVSSFIYSGTAAQVSTFYKNGLTLSGPGILGVAVAARAQTQDGSGPQNLKMTIRSGGTNYNSGNITSFGVGYQACYYFWGPNDPHTSAAWTLGNAQVIEGGVTSAA